MDQAKVWSGTGRGCVTRRIVVTISCVLAAVVLAMSPERAHGQDRQPAAAGAGVPATPLARYVPRHDLLFYLEFDGLDAHAAAWKGSAAYKLLNDTKLGALLEDLAGQGIELAQQSVPEDKRFKAAEVVDAVKHVARHGFVVGVWGKGPGKHGTVIVVRRGDRPEIRRSLDTFLKATVAGGNDTSRTAPIQKAGRTLHPLDNQGMVIWAEHGDLVLSRMPEEVLAVIDGKEPSALDHPIRVALAKAEGDFQPAAVAFLDMAAPVPLPADAVQLGLDGLKRIELRSGFQGEALLSVVRVVAPAPRRGVLALFDQPTFGMDSLPTLPANVTGFAVLSIDLARSYDKIVALLKQSNPEGDADVANFETRLRQRLGMDLRNDLLAHLGPKLAFYTQAPLREEAGSAADMLVSQFAGFTCSAQVRSEAAMARSIDPLIKAFNTLAPRQQIRVAARNRLGQVIRSLSFRRLDGPRPAYAMDLPPNFLPPVYSTTLRPTIMLDHDQLVLGASAAAAERAPRQRPALATCRRVRSRGGPAPRRARLREPH